jgi:hypothetical protein
MQHEEVGVYHTKSDLEYQQMISDAAEKAKKTGKYKLVNSINRISLK